jgi:hypothetical protein
MSCCSSFILEPGVLKVAGLGVFVGGLVEVVVVAAAGSDLEGTAAPRAGDAQMATVAKKAIEEV